MKRFVLLYPNMKSFRGLIFICSFCVRWWPCVCCGIVKSRNNSDHKKYQYYHIQKTNNSFPLIRVSIVRENGDVGTNHNGKNIGLFKLTTEKFSSINRTNTQHSARGSSCMTWQWRRRRWRRRWSFVGSVVSLISTGLFLWRKESIDYKVFSSHSNVSVMFFFTLVVPSNITVIFMPKPITFVWGIRNSIRSGKKKKKMSSKYTGN